MVGWRYQREPRPAAPKTPAPAPAPTPPREIPWINPVRTIGGACTCDVIYSSCRCAATNIRTQTSAQDFHTDQQQPAI